MGDEHTTETRGPDDSSRPLTRIGPYTLRRIIASGGMGTVYEAIQEHPRRTVAVKLMKGGITSAGALRRFEFESQILARLKHPGIAEVYEAGTHDPGTGPVPYFAMEYIPNAQSITSFAARRGSGVAERLRLFASVCDAVHHGHQKGIIHRDLKPDNIIVGPEGQPKVIDFGVARATDSDMAVATLQTEYGQLLGTLQYMSPEQIQGDPSDIDIRSDVYSLGVILYELLSGRPPYDLTRATPIEAARRIREDAPTRITTIDRALTGDPATIVHKALEKDRDRRYQSAGALADDIRHYLNGDPIAARPPTLAYQMKVFARKNRALVAAAAAVLAVLLVGVFTSTILYVRAEAQRAEAERQRQRALAAVGFLGDLVESADPMLVGTEVKIADLLRQYGRKVDDAFPDDPEIEASIRTSIANAYQTLNLYEKAGHGEPYKRQARRHLEKALRVLQESLGERHPTSVEAMRSLADLLQTQGNLFDAERLYRRVWEIRRERLGERDSMTIAAMLDVANVLESRGEYKEAEALTREGLDLYRKVLGEAHPKTLRAMAGLSGLRCTQGDLSGSEQICRRVIELRGPLEGASQNATDYGVQNLSSVLIAQGRIREARDLYGSWHVPDQLHVRKWLQGAGVDPASGKPTIIVSWEVWCPFSLAVMERLQRIHEKYGPRGLQMACVTQLSRTSTEEKVNQYLRRERITVPVAVTANDVWSFYGFYGVPDAAVVADGNVVWRGHPSGLTPAMLDGLVRAN
jgi:tetratricopeptide (TPR) repeat protein